MKSMYTLIFCGLISFSAMGNENPISLATDSRVKVVAYNENNVVSLLGTTFVNTQIIFSKEETIVDVQSGDATSWTVFVNKSIPYVLNLKPTVEKSDSDMDVITVDKSGKHRHYYFNLKSNKNVDDSPITYAIKFSYPMKEREHLASINRFNLQQEKALVGSKSNPQNYNWEYSFSGDKQLVPSHVFDDGHFTYLMLRKNQSVPAIFSVNRTGEESVVNFRKKDDYLIILRVSPQLSLRDGKNHVASIFNKPLINKIKGRG